MCSCIENIDQEPLSNVSFTKVMLALLLPLSSNKMEKQILKLRDIKAMSKVHMGEAWLKRLPRG